MNSLLPPCSLSGLNSLAINSLQCLWQRLLWEIESWANLIGTVEVISQIEKNLFFTLLVWNWTFLYIIYSNSWGHLNNQKDNFITGLYGESPSKLLNYLDMAALEILETCHLLLRPQICITPIISYVGRIMLKFCVVLVLFCSLSPRFTCVLPRNEEYKSYTWSRHWK